MRPSLRLIFRSALLLLAAVAFLAPAAHAEDFGGKLDDAIHNIFEKTKQEIPYCQDGQNCSLKSGSDIVATGVHDLVTNESASQYVQRIAGNVVMVLSIVGVLFIVYAGFMYLTAGGDDEQTKKAKDIIKGVVIGYIIIFLAWSIVAFITQKILKPAPTAVPQTGFIEELLPRAYAADGLPTQVTFDTYREQILKLVPAMQVESRSSGISAANLNALRAIVLKASLTLPDTGVNLSNSALVTDTLGSIDALLRTPAMDSLEAQLFKSLETFLTQAKVPQIVALASATPATGNSPLTSTLMVTGIKDPSGVQVPDENVVWAVRVAGGGYKVIGRGRSISNKFYDQGVNSVFVAILSSSKNRAGYTDVMPFKGQVEVQVLERRANVYLYVNGVNLSEADEIKLNPTDASKGVIIDATATTVPAGVSITRTSWNFGNGVTKLYDGAPKIERQPYASQNTYQVSLRLFTNRGETVDKRFSVVVRDPIAAITVDKTQGMVGEEFKFKTRSTYTNNGYTYVWEIRDPETGAVIYQTQGLSATYKFRKSGNFPVRLRTISPDNKEDVDSKTITIDSREPISKFTAKKSSQEMPDTYVFDASSSYDPDTSGGSLRFEWSVDGDPVTLNNPVRNGAVGTYRFTSIGDHRVGLSITNKDGKVATQESKLTVDSLLSVRLQVSPQIIHRAQQVSIVADAPHAEVFDWDFGDGAKETTYKGQTTHTYQKSGTYPVSLTVRNNSDPIPTSNTIRRSVYVVDTDQPFALTEASRDGDPILPTQGACDGKDAVVTDRVKATKFSAGNSINTDGKASGLSYFWQVGNDKTSTQRDLSYKFDELGCTTVKLTAKSDVTGKSSTQETLVRVDNAAPTLTNIDVQVLDLDADPIVVKLTAQNAKDPDGAIASYTWYYYTDDDSEPQGFRVTTLPTVTYVLPKVAGKYWFGLVMEDTNGAKANSEEISSERYSTPTLAADANLMTPVVKLAVSKDSPLVGDQVKFTATVRNVISQDISSKGNIEFKWDFDGDGFYDKQTTDPSVEYAYGLPGQFAAKVKVSYRGVSTTQSARVTVSNVLRPRLSVVTVGDRLIAFNSTSGFYKSSSWSADGAALSGNPGYVLSSYSGSAFPKQITLTVSDGTQDKSESAPVQVSRRNKLLVRASQDPLIVVSNKLVDASGNLMTSQTGITIDDASDKLWIYLGESKGSPDRFGIDADASQDSDLNGAPDDDRDNAGDASFTSGSPYLVNLAAYKRRNVTVSAFILGADGKVISKKDLALTLSYLPEEAAKDVTFDDVSDADRVQLEKLKGMIQEAPEGDRIYLMKSLSQLKDLWGDKVGKTETIIAMQGYVDASAMPEAAKKNLFSLLDSLITGDEQVADEITLAAGVVKNLIPNSSPAYRQVVVGDKAAGEPGLLDQILSHPNDAALNKELGKKVLDLIAVDDSISIDNKLIIKEQLRVIIAGGAANVTVESSEAVPADTSSTGMLHTLAVAGKWLIIVLLAVLGIVAVAGVALKMTNKNANTGFADGLIDLFGKGSGSAPKPSAPKPAVPAASSAPKPSVPAPAAPKPAVAPSAPAAPAKKEEVPDWLKAATAAPSSAPKPAAPSAPVSAPSAPSAPAPKPSDVPDWLKAATAPAAAPVPAATPKPAAAPAPQKEEVPDWLKAPAQPAPAAAAPAPAAPKPAVPAAPAAPAKPADDLPDWLKAPAAPAAPAPVSEIIPAAPKAAAPAPKAPSAPAKSSVDDLPDWLKAPAAPTPKPAAFPAAQAEPAEEADEAPATTAVYERTPDGKIVKKPVAKKKTSAKKEAKPDAEDKLKKPSAKKAA